ncbi:hypothetical protein AB3N59_15240 [Leptospira sp. WS92.C1]
MMTSNPIYNRPVRGIRIFFLILFIYLFLKPGFISADTVILKNGTDFKNVKTTLREDHVLVEDEFGNTERIELILVDKILVSEIQKPEMKEEKEEQKNIKKFYFSFNISKWNSKVRDSPGFNRGYNIVDFITTILNIDPYLETKYTVDVQTVSLQSEYRRSVRLGFSLGLEQNSFSFPDRGMSPIVGLFLNINSNSSPEYQALGTFSLIGVILNPHFGDYDNGKQAGSKFKIETLSFLPGLKYYIPISETIFWFAQTGFGIGRSYESGIYSKPMLQTVLFAGTGVQWESDSYFFNCNLQYRQTNLNGSARSYQFSEPMFIVGAGLKL